MLGPPKRAEALAFALVAAFILGNSLALRPRLLGDGAEYFAVAEAFARHASPDLRVGDREAVWQSMAEEGVDGAQHLAEVPTVEGRDGRTYTIHFWAYPLITLPARLVLPLLGSSALKAPQVTNATLFTAALGIALFQSPLAPRARRTLAALSLFSPALWFVAWPHPEVFSFSLTTAALVWRAQGGVKRATAAAAAASLQNPPLALLAAAIAFEGGRRALRGRSARAWAETAGVAGALAPAAIPSAFSACLFGTPSLLTRGAIDASNLSLSRTFELVFDLNLGLLPYAPLVLVASLVGVISGQGGTRWNWGLALAMAFLCTATCNWNSGTSGPTRYAVWIYPLVLDGFVRLLVRSSSDTLP